MAEEQVATVLPGLDALNRPYWTSGADEVLRIARCRSCSFYLHPPMPVCRKCGGDDVRPEAVSGRGRIATYTINRQRWLPGMKVPFIFAAVELEEQAGLYVLTTIENCPVDSVKSGMSVAVSFLEREGIFLPIFSPVSL
ncbi:MAG: OB-fold domain-containing protein [Sphingobium sp.]